MLILLFINIGLAFLSLYVLDMLQIIDYKQILNRVPFLKESYTVKIEDPYLLERSELEKKWQILDEKIRNYEQDKKKLEEMERNIALEKENVQKEKENNQNMIATFEKMKAEKESYDNRIDTVASQIENMPPKSAVAILGKQDDMMIIDILKKIDARANNNGRQSTSPYLLSLMDPEQSARIQRKMLETSGASTN
jgi:flagellar protein FlbB